MPIGRDYWPRCARQLQYSTQECCIEMLQILLVPDLVVNALITVLTTMHIHITGVMESLKSYFIKLVSDFLNCNMRKKVTDTE